MTFRLGWINDFLPSQHAGGSLRTQERAIQFAPAEVEIVWGGPEAIPTNCDFYLINAVTFLNHEQVDFLLDVPRIVWAHDVWVLAQQWMTEERTVARLCEGARRVVFLSRLHEAAFTITHLPALTAGQIKLAPAMVDPAPFEGLVVERDCDAFWMGTFDRFRGVRMAAEWAEQEGRELDMYGFGAAPPYLKNFPNVHLLPAVSYADVPATMVRYKTCVCASSEIGDVSMKVPQNPPFVEACGRVAIEATMAGCEVVHNGRLGASTWPWFNKPEATKAAMRNAPLQFWEMFMAAVLE